MAPVAAGLANSDTRFHREKWPSSLTRGGYFIRPINRPSSIAAINNASNEITSLTFIPIPF